MTTERQPRQVAYVSGTRADYGLMTPILRAVDKNPGLNLQIYATGIHLMPDFGQTVKSVIRDFPQTKTIDATFEEDTKAGMTRFIGKYMTRVTEQLLKDRPDIMILLGDRVEMLSTAMICTYLGIPIGHVAGGEKTHSVDEVARHAITKMAHLHLAATRQSARRIKKLGEEDWRIHTVGAPALDVILHERLPSRAELFQKLDIDTKEKIILVTQHPVSEEDEQSGRQMKETMAAVKKFNMPLVVIYPHADAGGRKIIEVIEEERNNPLIHIYPSLEYKTFLALERESAVWVGNSSAAMIESSSFGIPVVNIGTRQLGRQRGGNVIDTGYDRGEIASALEQSLNNTQYRARIKRLKNPWGDGMTGPRVARILEGLSIDSRLMTKQITY